MIRLEGAEVLCGSLYTNKVLTQLDLSYNALGRSAAEVLGGALINNNVSCLLINLLFFYLVLLFAIDSSSSQHRQQWHRSHWMLLSVCRHSGEQIPGMVEYRWKSHRSLGKHRDFDSNSLVFIMISAVGWSYFDQSGCFRWSQIGNVSQELRRYH